MDIVNQILSYIGSDHTRNWYVGIATNPHQRLFNDHSVDRQNGRWIFKDCLNTQNARVIEKYLLDNYSFSGGTGGGDNPRYIYAYQITLSTLE